MTDIELNENTSDEELADLIRANFKVRDLVAIWYEDDDAKQYMVKGGLDVMGRQFIYLRGLTAGGTVAVQIIPMKTIVDIEACPDQTSPYEVEERIEQALMMQKWGKSSAEEATLQALRAANGVSDAEVSERRAAAVKDYEATLWDEDERALREDYTPTSITESKEDAEEDGLIHCNQCEAVFARTMAYWVHLDEHDMMVLGERE